MILMSFYRRIWEKSMFCWLRFKGPFPVGKKGGSWSCNETYQTIKLKSPRPKDEIVCTNLISS